MRRLIAVSDAGDRFRLTILQAHAHKLNRRMNEIAGTVFLVFYTRPEYDAELFLSAHADVEGAREAAYLDACDNGGNDWTWGDDQPLYQLLNGTPVTADPSILTDWSRIRTTKGKTRYADVGHYVIVEVPLHTRGEGRPS